MEVEGWRDGGREGEGRVGKGREGKGDTEVEMRGEAEDEREGGEGGTSGG